MQRSYALQLATVIFVLASGCGQGSGTSTGGSGAGSSSTGSGQGGAGQGGAGQGGENVGGAFVGSGGAGNGTGGGGAGGPEVCDGIDNDNDGTIDNVDVGNDGICDCLRIATLGLAGVWGNGDVFATWLDTRSDNGAVSLNDQVLTKDLLDKYQVIVAQNLSELGRTYSTAEVEALSEWVKAGGGFMTLIGYADPAERTNVNTLLGAFGMSYGAQQILPKNGGATIPVTNWVTHPVTNGVTRIGVDNGYPVEGTGQTLATEQGHDLLKAQEVGSGHVLMWGDEWITYDSEWTEHPEYQLELFWLNAIKWLTPAKNCQVTIPTPK
ncbi:ThuA domain-containing protein [Polyangium sp. 15x6]|uniref:ThuA domain-containing protein n=1 Tax=Polyangium sp. 15x6 TaxID=3042687 RepID=UPI00249CBBBF|nr:ThuA domain-containing protein [Polyangium sp. 15x6]MDI3286849.1 ThuA domain-containing protein [Polyangium sp. 15x6]